MDSTGADESGDVDNEHRFLRWVEDPSGQRFGVQLVKTSGVAGPVFLGAPGGGRLLRGVLGVLNKGLVRVQRRPHNVEGCSLEVFRVDGDDEESVLDDWDWDDDWDTGRRRAEGVVREIRAGTFVAPDLDD